MALSAIIEQRINLIVAKNKNLMPSRAIDSPPFCNLWSRSGMVEARRIRTSAQNQKEKDANCFHARFKFKPILTLFSSPALLTVIAGLTLWSSMAPATKLFHGEENKRTAGTFPSPKNYSPSISVNRITCFLTA